MKKLFGLILFLVLLAPVAIQAQTPDFVVKNFVEHSATQKISYMVMNKVDSSCWILQADMVIVEGLGLYQVTLSPLDPYQYKKLLPYYGSENEDDVFLQAVLENLKNIATQLFNSVNNQVDD